MNCTDTWAHAALDRLFVGELEQADHQKLRQHVEGCPSCSKQYDRVSQVDARLSKAEVLSAGRLELLQGALFDKLAAADAARSAAKPGRARWWMPALGFALAAGLAVAIAYVPTTTAPDPYQARGGAVSSAFGVRAFCVQPLAAEPTVVAEAQPGGKLKCPAGSAIQLTYTAPRAAKLKIDVKGPSGTLPMFPTGGGSNQVAGGVDVPLSFSTPVTPEWLSAPAEIVASFEDDEGKVSATVITVEP